MRLKKTKLVLYSNTLKSVIEIILRSWFVNSLLGFWVIILKNGYMVHLSVFGQPCLAPQQQLEKKWSGARANGGLSGKRLIGPSPLTVGEKNRSLCCSTRMPLKEVVFLLKRTRVIPFSRDLLHFVRLRSQPYTSSVTISAELHSLVHMVRVSFSCPGASRESRRSWPWEPAVRIQRAKSY